MIFELQFRNDWTWWDLSLKWGGSDMGVRVTFFCVGWSRECVWFKALSCSNCRYNDFGRWKMKPVVLTMFRFTTFLKVGGLGRYPSITFREVGTLSCRRFLLGHYPSITFLHGRICARTHFMRCWQLAVTPFMPWCPAACNCKKKMAGGMLAPSIPWPETPKP